MITNIVRCQLKLGGANRLIRSVYFSTSRVRLVDVSSSESTIHSESGQKSDNKSARLEKIYDTGKLVLNHRALARLADSSATGQFNNTNILVTVVNKPKSTPSSFLPLTVDYLHKASAAGKIPSTYTRRDFGASNYEVLVSRMIDRSIRPLFGSSFGTETQVVCNLLSYDGKDNPDVLCINTVSYALHGSTCDWKGPIGCVRVGMEGKEFVINPSRKSLEKSPLNLVLTVGPNKNIIMIEGWADNIDQDMFLQAIHIGAQEAFGVVEAIRSMKLEKDTDIKIPLSALNQFIPETESAESAKESIAPVDLDQVFDRFLDGKLYNVLTDYEHDKTSRDKAISQLRNSVINKMLKSTEWQENQSLSVFGYQQLSEAFYKYLRKQVRLLALNESKRVDGRAVNELRPISCQVGMYESLHGSALFQRGQTQVLCSITFDSPETMYRSDSIANMMSPSITNFNKNFMLHYEFPSFATNEIARVGGRADRREIGHGALAEKAVYPLFPENFVFTVRSLCEVLESNGSSSMASVCATSLALMDAGVPIKEPVCGVAMGIFVETDDQENIQKYKILTDISGFEDYMGDMDFKVAGTFDGITALQVSADFKIKGLPFRIIKEVLDKSKSARRKILKIMNQTIPKPSSEEKPNKPVMKNLEVQVAQRAKFIGVGGINLKRIYNKCGVSIIPIDEGTFKIFAPNKTALDEADEMIKGFLDQPREPELEFGGIYTAKIVEILAAGLMVQLYPGMKPALLPNNQLEGRKIVHSSATDYKVGQEIQVKYFGRDPVDGKMRLSRKALFKTTSPVQDLNKVVQNS